jgi:hypothetical protein
MSNFRRVLTDIDVRPLLGQVANHSKLWNTNSSRTSVVSTVHYAVDDIILRFPGKGVENWNLSPFNALTEAQPIVFRLMGVVWGELLGRVVISRLPPGRTIPPHIDRLQNDRTMFYHRYQVPLASEPGVEFHIEDEQMFLEPGNAYWIANTKQHWVVNNSNAERISMIVDIRPFSPQ